MRPRFSPSVPLNTCGEEVRNYPHKKSDQTCPEYPVLPVPARCFSSDQFPNVLGQRVTLVFVLQGAVLDHSKGNQPDNPQPGVLAFEFHPPVSLFAWRA